MPCTNTQTAYQNVRGGKPKFKKPKNMDGIFTIQVPCKECLSCMQRNAMDWATRQYCETVTNTGIGANIFLTCTYANEHIPDFGHYNYEDIQDFIKRTRSYIDYYAGKAGIPKEDVKFKYVCAPEYGDTTQRPHFHLNLFNLWLPDFQRKGITSEGKPAMTSESLESCWGKGIIDIQTFGMGSARYLANHNIKQNGKCLKAQLKISYYAKRQRLAKEQKTDYPYCPETGLIMPEKMPGPRIYPSNGIGLEYLKRYQLEIYSNDFITVQGQKYPPPRYFDRKLRELDLARWVQVMKKRKENQREYDQKELDAIAAHKLHVKNFFKKPGKV